MMRRFGFGRAGMLVAMGLISMGALPGTAVCQRIQDVHTMVRDLRVAGEWRQVARVLAGREEGFAEADREMLADSLKAIALGGETMPSRNATFALAFAGRPENGTPYLGALPRLRAVVLEASDTQVKVNAFGALLDVVGAPAEFELIQSVATAEGVLGTLAFLALVTRGDEDSALFRPEMKPILRRVVEAGGFESPEARISAEAQAAKNGWEIGGGGFK